MSAGDFPIPDSHKKLDEIGVKFGVDFVGHKGNTLRFIVKSERPKLADDELQGLSHDVLLAIDLHRELAFLTAPEDFRLELHQCGNPGTTASIQAEGPWVKRHVPD